MPKLNPCFGSVSPVSRVNNPGFPSSAGIGVKAGDSFPEESPPDAAASAAFTGARDRAGVGVASLVELLVASLTAPGAAADVVGVAAAVFATAGSATAAALVASAFAAAAFLSSALAVAMAFAAPAVHAPTKNKMAAHRRNLIIPPPLLPHSFG